MDRGVQPDGAVRSVYASPNATGVFGADLPTDTDLAATLASRIYPDDQDTFSTYHAVAAGDSAETEVRVRGYDGVTVGDPATQNVEAVRLRGLVGE
jgi:hypothetical protein